MAACAPDSDDRGAPAVTQESVFEGILENMRAAGAEVELEEDITSVTAALGEPVIVNQAGPGENQE